MKKIVGIIGIALLSVALAGTAKETEMAQKIRLQNQQVVAAAAKALNKKLPKKVDTYTQLINVKADKERLIYTFMIDAGPKSDAQVIEEGEARMQRNVTAGICQSSQRFLKSGITIVYDYISAHTKKELFHIVVDDKSCQIR